RAVHPGAHPAALGQHVVEPGPTSGDDLVVQPAGQRQVREAVAMHVAHLPAAVAVLDAAETVRSGFDPGPGTDRIPDQLTSSFDPRVLSVRCRWARRPHLTHLGSSPVCGLHHIQGYTFTGA